MDLKCLKYVWKRADYNIGVERRLYNIESFSKLDKTGLEFDKIERKILLYKSSIGEKVFIQYPGKESKGNEFAKIRPWDFRPKLERLDGTIMDDLSFKNIWDDLIELEEVNKEVLEVLSSVFFRLSLMKDTILIKGNYEYQDFNKGTNIVVNSGEIQLEWHRVKIQHDVLEYLNSKINDIQGVSIEAYIYYNDLLCQNEDCKYFYRDLIVNEKDKWSDSVGRKNTYWTHLSIISFIKGLNSFTQIMDKFQRGRGVAPITLKELEDVTGGTIKK